MKSVKWFYVGAMAIALGMLTFATAACHYRASGHVAEGWSPERAVS